MFGTGRGLIGGADYQIGTGVKLIETGDLCAGSCLIGVAVDLIFTGQSLTGVGNNILAQGMASSEWKTSLGQGKIS